VNRREFLLQSSAVALRPSITGGQGLRDQGKPYGTAASSFQLRDGDFAAALAREAAILVPEYEMKRGVIEPSPGRYDFSGVDKLLAFARAHAMQLRGHPLVWHKRNPDWLTEVGAESQLMGYISQVMSRYSGQFHSWDVVNEAIDVTAPGNLRQTIWLKRFGRDYIDIAFEAARAADPEAMLVYNDWGCELGAPDNDRFRAATLDFLEGARARGVPIDALGLQGHLGLSGPQVDQAKLAIFLDRVKAMGFKILITEHDVDDDGGAADPATRDRQVADASRRFLDVAAPHAVAVLTWGLSDRYLDPPSWRQKLMGWSPRRLPLDASLARKPLWTVLSKELARH
jgi:endo-1,4-beta-xylanase